MRGFFCLSLMLCLIIPVKGQNAKKIEEAVALNEELVRLIDHINGNPLSMEVLQKTMDRKASVKEGLREVMATGTAKEKDAAGLYDMLMEFHSLNVYFKSGRVSEFYPAMVALEPTLYGYLDPKRFPIEYTYQGRGFQMPYKSMESIVAKHYAQMIGHSIALDKYKEAIDYCRLTADFESSEPKIRYSSLHNLQFLLRTQGYPMADRLDAYVKGMEVWKTLDAETIAMVKDKGFGNFDQMADSVLAIAPLVNDGDRRALAVLAAVRLLVRVDLTKSAALLNTLSEVRTKSRYCLDRMYRYSDTLGLSSLKSRALASWEALGVSGNRQVASLRGTTASVLQTDPVNGDGFKSISGASTNSRFYANPSRRSRVCLRDAVECLTSGFKNSVTGQDYLFWICVVAEEPGSNLKGTLQPLFRELCGELGMLYRQSPMEYEYDSENLYRLVLSRTSEVKVSYYNHSGTGSDIIMMEVKFTR